MISKHILLSQQKFVIHGALAHSHVVDYNTAHRLHQIQLAQVLHCFLPTMPNRVKLQVALPTHWNTAQAWFMLVGYKVNAQ